MKKRTLLPLTLAAAFALAGCSGGGGDEAAKSSSPAEQTASSSSTTTDLKGAAGSQLTALQLAEIADELAGDDKNVIIIDEETIAAQLPLIKKQNKALKTEPERCAPFVENGQDLDLDAINTINVAIPGATATEAIGIQIVSYLDVSKASAEMDKSPALLKTCPEFSITEQGTKAEIKSSGIAAKTNAPRTEAVKMTTTAPTGEFSSVQLSAQKENNLIVVSLVGVKDAKSDVAKAEELTNKVLGLLNK
ncbi:hypothetical protein CQ018_10715 [Arthrobacter sp. MYb227]|uniref:sensor domain-containing protein n=1 Tax=Arthrobacter sp. MYb227 TaxID=1848601 RepID=UPI000CFB9FB5|nr:sensor domain-containing protein [Arthrobacter sp. MYb227]PQZ92932.1 hypothetical protein CQ018_10715 [Arthrobacter sp. MYb227]